MKRHLCAFLLLSLIPAGFGAEYYQLAYPNLPEVASPSVALAEFGYCDGAASDTEVERCGGGLDWASEIVAFVEFTGEWNVRTSARGGK